MKLVCGSKHHIYLASFKSSLLNFKLRATFFSSILIGFPCIFIIQQSYEFGSIFSRNRNTKFSKQDAIKNDLKFNGTLACFNKKNDRELECGRSKSNYVGCKERHICELRNQLPDLLIWWKSNICLTCNFSWSYFRRRISTRCENTESS